MVKPERPKLADPASTARVQATRAQTRGKPIYEERSQLPTSDLSYWEVEVTPLEATTSTGRGFDAGLQKPRAIFEVRALYYGTGLPEFGSQPNTRLVPQSWEEDEELALEMARRITELLRQGTRELDILAIGREVKRRRA